MGKIGEWFEQQLQKIDISEQNSDDNKTNSEANDNVSRETFVGLQNEIETLKQLLSEADTKVAEINNLRSDLAAAQALNRQLAAETPLNANKKTFSEIIRGELYHPLYKGE